MRTTSILPAAVLCACVLAPLAPAQYAARSAPAKVPGVANASGSGGFLQGADDCNAPHTNVGSGDVLGVPFTTGTTGTTGQNEASCYLFGSTGIDGDVWFDWTATLTSLAGVSTCLATGVDTKIAVWPNSSPSSCPAPGSSLACNDDACGLQSTTVWSVTAGTTYTIQLGTFPGAPGGSGTFDVTQTVAPACGQMDDGGSENALGLIAGGEIGWLQYFDCDLAGHDTVATAYGTLMFPGSMANGGNSRLVVYADQDGDRDPTGGLQLLTVLNTVVTNADTDVLNPTGLGLDLPPGGGLWTTCVMATADHLPGEFPGPIDQTFPTPNSWVVGRTAVPGALDVVDLSANDFLPERLEDIGFPGAWMLRTLDTGGGSDPGTPTCFGDGGGAPCGCGNEDPAGTGGCLNGLGLGAVLSASGVADTANDTLALTCAGVRTETGMFFQGDAPIGTGGATFGDGIRCCGQSVVRLEVVLPAPPQPATARLGVPVTDQGPAGTVGPGDTKCYQYWYRDPGLSPCGTNFNLSNGLSITWF